MAEGGLNSSNTTRDRNVERVENEGGNIIYRKNVVGVNVYGSVNSLTVNQGQSTSRRESLVESVVKELESLKVDKTAEEMINSFDEETVNPDDPIVRVYWGTIKRRMSFQHLERDDLQIAQGYQEHANDTFEKGKQFRSKNQCMHAVTAFFASANLHKEKNDGDKSVKSITECVQETRETVKKMVKEQPEKKKMVMKRVIPIAYEMAKLIQSIPTSTKDVKVINEATCLFYIALCYGNCDDYEQYAKVNENSIALLKKEFKGRAVEYKTFAKSLNNVGKAYGETGNRKVAAEKYKTALEVYVNATDWESDEEKNGFKRLIERNIKKNEKKMKKELSA